jgi:hypothetical protein
MVDEFFEKINEIVSAVSTTSTDNQEVDPMAGAVSTTSTDNQMTQ